MTEPFISQFTKLLADKDLTFAEAADLLFEIKGNLLFQDHLEKRLPDSGCAQHFAVAAIAKIEDAYQTLRLTEYFANNERKMKVGE